MQHCTITKAIIKETEIKGIQIRKEEVKLSIHAYYIISYIETPQESTKKLLQLINSILMDWKTYIVKMAILSNFSTHSMQSL